MNALPDVYDYPELGTDAPEPDDGTCTWCGELPCRDDCRPPSCRGEEPDYPTGAEHYMDVQDRYGEVEG